MREMEERDEKKLLLPPSHEAMGKGCGKGCGVSPLPASPVPRRVCVCAAACVTLPVSPSLLPSKLGKGFCSVCPASFQRLCFSCKARVLDLC